MIAEVKISTAQHLSSPRGIGICAFTALSRDIYSLDWNPAGLSRMQDWEAGISNFISSSSNQSGITLNSIGAGKKFLGNQASAVSYSPGKFLEFIVPATFDIYDSSGNAITTKFDKKISFHQTYSLGYSYQIPDNFSIGFSAKYFETKVSDTKYIFDTTNAIRSQIKDYNASLWTIDVGALYNINPQWTLGVVVKNLFEIKEQELKEEVWDYRLNLSKLGRLGIAYSGFKDLTLSAEGDTKRNFRAGSEISPYSWLQIRCGLHSDRFVKFEAAGIGLGVSYMQFQFDLGYLKFFDQSNRKGSINTNTFKSTSFVDIDYTPFTADRISFSLNAKLGRTKETLARIEYVEMLSEVFPASTQIYAFRPLGKARIKNISSKTISAKVSFFVNDFMSAPTETKAYQIPPNETAEIPFFAVFNDLISAVRKFSVYDGTVYVHAEVSEEYDDRYQTRVLIRGRNDWDGDVMLLKYFVTPNDPDVLTFTRAILNQNKSHLDSVTSNLQNFQKAKVVFNSFTERLLYVHDPKSSKDFVQYPSETLSLHGGDCDDMTVCYSAMLMSMGISTAFIDVVPPEHPEDSHIYMMFDTGISPNDAHSISENQKRYVIRRNDGGNETIWIPIETTIVKNGFEKAWETGAEQYFQNAEIDFGIAKGWMRVVDLQPTF